MSNTEPHEFYRRLEAVYMRVEDPDYVEPETVTTITASCIFCGETGISSSHSCQGFVSQGFTRERAPNRFDPYEALELIDRANLSPLNLQDSLTLIHEQVGLLRAYITGIER